MRKHRLGDDPLKVTPPLGLTNYVFPVAGVSSYSDTYGGYRGDVPGNWHHGDDIFAALGTPVVAVADGTLNRVGWEHLGGWRLWVRDHNRNQFYYAHLSGYSPLALHSKFVKKGDVIGFVGNSGDAFTTPPHVHFEIHPHQLLRLDYNGAVESDVVHRRLASPRQAECAGAGAPAVPRGAGAPRGELHLARAARGARADRQVAEAERAAAHRGTARRRRVFVAAAPGRGEAREAAAPVAGAVRLAPCPWPTCSQGSCSPPCSSPALWPTACDASAPRIVIVSLHVATGAALGALSGSRVAAALLGPPAHLLGDRIPHQDIASRRFEIGERRRLPRAARRCGAARSTAR